MKPQAGQLARFVLSLLAGSLLVFLFYRAQPVNPVVHERVVESLAAIQKMDADTDSLVLKLRYLLHDNYDSLVLLLDQIHRQKASLEQGSYAIAGKGDSAVDKRLEQLTRTLAEKEALIERFKMYNAVLKNSLYYFPNSVAEASGHAGVPLKQEMDGLMQEILLLHVLSNKDYPRVELAVARLEAAKQRLAPPLRAHVEDVVRHARIILNYETRVDEVVTRILGSPNRGAAEQLAEAYSDSFRFSLQATNTYRFFLLAASLLLLGYAGTTFYRLREAAQELNQGRRFLQTLTNALGEGVYSLDAQGLCTYLNPEAERLLGWKQEELLGKSLHEIVHRRNGGDELCTASECRVLQSLARGEAFRDEELFSHKDGTPFPVALTSVPLREGERIVGSVATFQDISARKQVEETLRKFSRALEQSANSVIITSAEGNIEYVNPKFCELTGYQRQDVLGKNPRLLKSGETSAERYQELWTTISHGGEWRGEFHNRRKDGSLFWESASIGPIRDDKGVITHFLAIKEDITHRKEIEAQLWHLNETLEQRVMEESAKNREKDLLLIKQSRLAAMGEMIGNIAHQWRQPLNALNLILCNIKDAYDFNELNGKYLDETVAHGKRLANTMSSTIDDFRNFFRPDKRKDFFSLKEAVEHALSLIEPSFKHANIAIDFQWAEDIRLLGFHNEFSQALLNILTNAKDAIQEHGIVAGKVEVSLKREGNHAQIAIRDNAGGIAPGIIDKVFDPYFTTREKGTGIGLYMSKMIIENNMHGELRVHNWKDGAEFVIALPVEQTGNDVQAPLLPASQGFEALVGVGPKDLPSGEKARQD